MEHYDIGEKVKLINKQLKVSDELYMVEGYHFKQKIQRGESHIEVTYTLKNMKSGTILNTSPQFIIKPYSVNELLDYYNDYKLLYEWFGDEEYKEKMEESIYDVKRIIRYHLY